MTIMYFKPICYCTFHTLLYVAERRELKLNYKIELSPSRYIKEGVESTIKIWLEILANLHTLFLHYETIYNTSNTTLTMSIL